MATDEVIELPELEKGKDVDVVEKDATKETETPQDGEVKLKVSKRQFYFVYAAMLMGMFLVSLDQTIVSTALPDIVSEFERLDLYSWVVVAYLLTSTCIVPLAGKLSDLFGRKALFLSAITIFLAGSILCGAAQSMMQLIIFRGIQGVGGGPISSLVYIIIADMVPTRELSKYTSVLGLGFAVSSVSGPLIGGLITEHISWRWIFYVNVPFCVLAIILVAKEFNLPTPSASKPWREKVKTIDYIGAILLVGAITSILLAMSFGGNQYPWKSYEVICLALAGGLVFGGFLIWEYWVGENAFVYLSHFIIRNVALADICTFLLGFSLLGGLTYVPVFFQVVEGNTPTISGLKLMPMTIGLIAASIVVGNLVSKTGSYYPFPIIGNILMTIAYVLFGTTWHRGLSYGLIFLYLLLLGLGMGAVIQTYVVIVQSSVSRAEMATVTAANGLIRILGGVVGVTIMGSIQNNEIRNRVDSQYVDYAFAGHDSIESLGEPLSSQILDDYAKSMDIMFLAVVPVCGIAVLIALFIKRIKISKANLPKTEEPAGL
mmetsp:Transcript_27444/g.38707  ORF Transcript_27444/g.38707 Transcript_27444/m.38707 type:complete len:545 (+) Transcript_27444:62-1696(+)